MAAGHTLPNSLKLLVFLLTIASIIRGNAHIRLSNDQRALQAAALPSMLGISTGMPFADTNLISLKSRAKRFLTCRVQHTVKGTSSFNLVRDVLVCGDVRVNPGPTKTKLEVSQPEGLQRRSELQDAAEQSSTENEHTIPDNAKLECLRKHFNKDLLMGHLNINSIQNKFEELTATIKTIGAHVMFISETKIDSSYPNPQFSTPGYSLYRNDRKKGGGDIMALVSSSLTKKRLKPTKNYKTLELIALGIKRDASNMIIIGIYRPPRNLCGDYQLLLENELSQVCNWASLQSNSVVIIGDLNLDRLSPDKREGKLLLDLEIEQGFTCLISKPTRVERRGTITSHSLIDVLLTNRPELSKQSGNYYPALSDHALIFGIVRDRIKSNKPKIISFRSLKISMLRLLIKSYL